MTPNLFMRKDDHYLSLFITGVTKQRTDTEKMYSDDGVYTGERRTLHYTSVVRAFTNEYGVVDLK